MQERICTSCDEPHVTRNWYVIKEINHPRRGDVECKPAHEDRIRRESREVTENHAFNECGHRHVPNTTRLDRMGQGNQ
jgi:hypothetical protein